METIRGAYSRILSRPGGKSGNSGLALVRYESSGQMVDAKLSGPFSPLSEPDEWFVAEGDWKENTFRGRKELIFRARNVQPDLPITKVGAHQLFSRTFSPDFHGVGSKAIEAFIDAHGPKAALKAEANPKLLLEMSADRERFGSAILRDWSKRISARQPIRIMEQAGVQPNAARAILRVHRDSTMDIIKANPYHFARISNVGFDEADKIGRHMGIATDDPRRVAAAVEAAVTIEDGEGHTYMPFTAMKPHLEKYGLGAEALRNLISKGGDGGLVFDREAGGPVAQKRRLHDSEKTIAVAVSRLLQNGRSLNRAPIDEVAEEVLSSDKYAHFDEVQKNAVRTSVRESVAILTGGPGTGKSTVTEAISEIAARTCRGPVLLMAPTGKAARRLEETTGRAATTVHRALGAQGEGPSARFEFTRSNPLPAGCFVVVDEASMLDTEIAAALLEALPVDGRILFVGDRNQLPSVGPGYVLGDMIEARADNGARVPCSELLKVYRNKMGSVIAQYAAEIRDGKFDSSRLDNLMRGGVLKYNMSGAAITERIVRLLSKIIPKSLNLDPMKDVAVLCPQRTGVAGTWALNAALSRELNPKGLPIQGLTHGPDDNPRAPLPRVGDRVMLTRNDYENDVMNGDIGTITDCFFDATGIRKERKVRVKFDAGQEVDFPVSKCRDLTLAYAITGHKSQGSQYPCVVMPVSLEHKSMLDRTLLYTEWTRAKDFLIIVGEDEAFDAALANTAASVRRTRLRTFLEKTLSQLPSSTADKDSFVPRPPTARPVPRGSFSVPPVPGRGASRSVPPAPGRAKPAQRTEREEEVTSAPRP